MEVFLAILKVAGAAIGTAQAGYSLAQYVARAMQKWACKKTAAEIKQFLLALGKPSEQAIRNLVENWCTQNSVDEDRREELVAILVNLSRGSRFLTTQGSPRSSFLRSEKLIEQLLADVQPVCQRGETATGNWKLDRHLGMGAFGEVWLAKNAYFPELRAFKFFTRDEARDLIKQEQQNLYQVKVKLGTHPNIVAFHDVALEEVERPYLELEYVGGGSLEDWILEDHDQRVALDKHDVILDVVQGLAEAHGQGIYHRDLKPANILLTEKRPVTAKIADFGLAKVVQRLGNEQYSQQVSQYLVVGTRMYLPPEANEVFAQRIPSQDDVFALGVVWYQLLVERLERPPYDFEERLREVGVDTHTIRLISRCLSQPARRFKDAGALGIELDEAAPRPWKVPDEMFDVEHVAREYLASLPR